MNDANETTVIKFFRDCKFNNPALHRISRQFFSVFFSFLLMWSGTILFLQRNQDNKCLCCLSISPSQYIISRIWYWQGITARGIQISLESSWCMAFYQLFIIGGSYSCWASLIVIHVQIFARRKIENWSPSDHILILYGNFLCIFYSLNNILLLF